MKREDVPPAEDPLDEPRGVCMNVESHQASGIPGAEGDTFFMHIGNRPQWVHWGALELRVRREEEP